MNPASSDPAANEQYTGRNKEVVRPDRHVTRCARTSENGTGMTLKVLFAGVDGTGKTASLNALVPRLDAHYRVLRLGNSGYFWSHRGLDEPLIGPRVLAQIDRARELANRFHLYGVFLVGVFLFKFLVAKYFERFRDVDLVMHESDPLIHPTVFVGYHFPWLRRTSLQWRFRTLSRLIGSPRKTLILFLEADVSVSLARVERRTAEGGPPLDPHENFEDLTALKADFDETVRSAEREGYSVLRVDTSTKSVDEVASQIDSAIRDRLSGRSESPRPETAHGLP